MDRIDPARVASILVVKPDHVGDLMLAVPALQRLRRFFPKARIDVLGRPEVHEFSIVHGLVDRVIPFRSPWLDRVLPGPRDWLPLALRLRALRRERYDLAVNFRTDFRDLLLVSMSRAKWRVSYDHRGLGPLLTHRLPPPDEDVHENVRWTGLLSAAGILAPDEPFRPRSVERLEGTLCRVLAPLSGSKRMIAAHLFSRRDAKNWPQERFVELLRWLVEEEEATVLLVGGQGDRDRHARVLRRVDSSRLVDCAGEMELAGLPALLRRCDAFIGVDSGPAHVAALVGTPSVVLFSGTNLVSRWRPPGDQVTILDREVPCRPCHLRRCDREDHACMTGIGVKDVVRTLRHLTSGSRGIGS